MRRLDQLPDDEFLRVGAHRQLNRAIRTASGEPAVALVHDTANEYGIDLIPYSVNVASEAVKDEAWRISCETATALVEGDIDRLFACNRRFMDMFRASWTDWEAIERDPGRLPKINDVNRPEFQLPNSRAERLAREILREIRLMGWKSGERIGGGDELMRRYSASPNILRQAVRMLQEHSAVRMDKGRSGGLFVATPDRQRAIDRASAFLRQSAAAPSDIRAFLVHLMFEALGAGPVIPADTLRDGLGAAASVSFEDLCRTAAKGSESPVVQIFTDVLLPFVPGERPSPVSGQVAFEALTSPDPVQRRRVLLVVAKGQSGARQVV
jgi:hypothetical protein